ncbi:hypothetical protein [Amnibacterium sp.]|jgi:hypothetical protein|uniref:hypothetical protein n=1 Tax=Amnibacterium sp. TaxID=1872496 RepID=UPI0026371C36|nr:hypothetical protein [Amnibacterium sp.]MCU1474206.1 hypothetical protein [Amnibacterium sp.]
MLQPPSGATAALALRLAALAAEADELPSPDPMLDGWASVAALEYQAAVARLTVGLLRLRAALHGAAAALEDVR